MTDLPELSPGDIPTADRTGALLSVQAYRWKFWARRYWWIAALTIMLGLAVTDYLCLRDVPEYVSSSRMMVSGRISLPQGELYNEGMELVNFYGTQVAVMKSPQTVNQAVDRVASMHPEVTVDPDAEVDAGLELRTSIFSLTVTSTNPDYAKLLLDSIMDTYLSSKREWRNQTTDEAVSAITEEIAHLDAEIRGDEQELLDFQKNNNVVFIEEQSSNAAAYLVQLNGELAELTKQHDLLSLENKDPLAASIESDSVTAIGKVGDTDPAIESALPGDNVNHEPDAILDEQDRIEKLKILREQFGVYLKDAHPKMKALADSIANEEKFLEMLKTRSQTTRDAHREDLELRIKNLEQQIVTQNSKSLELSQRLGTYQELKSKITREQALYNQLASSIQNVDLNKSLDQEDVVIMEAASPAQLVKHNYLLRLLYGLAGGLVVGLAIMVAVISLDDKINSRLDIEENFDFPLVGEIPLARLDKKSKRVPLLSEDDQRHDFLEHHRDIRSNILFGRSEFARNRSLMITSAAPGEGKSTLAANLATTFAFSGIRVLLIDADLRRGILHLIFDLPLGPGLSDYLQGQLSWREATQTTKISNLDLLPRGKIPSRVGDLLLTGATDDLIQESLDEYDMVLWDTPPLFAAHDAANLCSRVDGILFMARVRHSSINLVRSALNDLFRRNAKVFGVVLNAVGPGQHSYYHKYRYKEYGAVVAEV
ncbi:MAG TPA: polysaccharide biosynthesis tyrosine autokinase [Candidatus Methylacidiphilales bacterium]|nr:polysaccharide biosynthesis tyrosine autokinase [Candidatus Methylacidiphilales bacterium]